jgi:hypothetical protein
MGEEIGSAEITKEGMLVSGTGELEIVSTDTCQGIVSMLTDAGVLSSGFGDFRRIICSFPGKEYLITVGSENIHVVLRST